MACRSRRLLLPAVAVLLTAAVALCAGAGEGRGAVAAKDRILHSKVAFVATGRPTFIKIRGEGKIESATMQVTNGKLDGHFRVDLSTLDTGIDLRNTHMREKYLEVDKFPHAVLAFRKVPIAANGSEEVFGGRLDLHGHSRPVEVSAKVERSGPRIRIAAHFTLLLTDYGVAIPSYKGITVAKRVALDVDAVLATADAAATDKK